MHCCVCERACWHVGGPFYCDLHRPGVWRRAMLESKPIPMCTAHCYCESSIINGIKHKRCCNCGNQQAEYEIFNK
jgi:hypothetical protein